MQKLFNKILVPVISRANSGLAVDKAVQLANRFCCDIHLLEVTPSWSAGKMSSQIEELKTRAHQKLQVGLSITASFVSGELQLVFKQTVNEGKFDLVVIPKNRRKLGLGFTRRIDLNNLAQETQCPVLSVTRKFNVSNLYNIVVPVNDFLPVRKLNMATYLGQQESNIHLLSGNKNSNRRENKKNYLIKAYQLLNEYGKVKVYCSLPDNFDNPSGILSYARSIKADLIVVNTGKESLLRGWWSGISRKHLYRESEIPVLTIATRQEAVQLI